MEYDNRKRNLSSLSSIQSPKSDQKRIRHQTQQGSRSGSFPIGLYYDSSLEEMENQREISERLEREKQAIFTEIEKPDCNNKLRLQDRINLINLELRDLRLHDTLKELKSDVMKSVEFELKTQDDKWEKKFYELEKKYDDLNSVLAQNVAKSVENNQYARRLNIRISGIIEKPQENLPAILIGLVQSKMNITLAPHDIEIIHRLGQYRADARNPREIIVKLRYRDIKWNIMKARRGLKGSGIVFYEDLCPELALLAKNLKTHPKITATWGWNGKVMAKDIYDKIHTIQYGRKDWINFFDNLVPPQTSNIHPGHPATIPQQQAQIPAPVVYSSAQAPNTGPPMSTAPSTNQHLSPVAPHPAHTQAQIQTSAQAMNPAPMSHMSSPNYASPHPQLPLTRGQVMFTPRMSGAKTGFDPRSNSSMNCMTGPQNLMQQMSQPSTVSRAPTPSTSMVPNTIQTRMTTHFTTTTQQQQP